MPPVSAYPSQRELQLPLLHVLAEAGGEATSRSVQDALAERFCLPEHLRTATTEVGPGNRVNRWGRHVRWAQQHARLAGYTTSPAAGVWRLSRSGEHALGNQRRGTVVTVAVTGFGLLVWAHAEDLAGVLDDGSVQLFYSSPPFPLNRRKGYANQHPARAHVEWLIRLVERYLNKLAPEGSIVLEVGPAWTPGEPTQATWMERLVIAMEDRLGLHLCQTL
ncbi:MAG TPA: winged helix-turn-helix domain-containing protein, partial [Longimicrobium sp.]|nr:winged helix-turn-helix domain-containing protein [Longimicrobium sp.]